MFATCHLNAELRLRYMKDFWLDLHHTLQNYYFRSNFIDRISSKTTALVLMLLNEINYVAIINWRDLCAKQCLGWSIYVYDEDKRLTRQSHQGPHS